MLNNKAPTTAPCLAMSPLISFISGSFSIASCAFFKSATAFSTSAVSLLTLSSIFPMEACACSIRAAFSALNASLSLNEVSALALANCACSLRISSIPDRSFSFAFSKTSRISSIISSSSRRLSDNDLTSSGVFSFASLTASSRAAFKNPSISSAELLGTTTESSSLGLVSFLDPPISPRTSSYTDLPPSAPKSLTISVYTLTSVSGDAFGVESSSSSISSRAFWNAFCRFS
mmetsp:Transcript_3434/g.4977  ORF Transcript_3434/g.4977 Transcript_3434/m.4977 type:complete len:232 (+) Transcript_3434:311-1006(+)